MIKKDGMEPRTLVPHHCVLHTSKVPLQVQQSSDRKRFQDFPSVRLPLDGLPTRGRASGSAPGEFQANDLDWRVEV